jgi:hypothetical protein
MIDKPFMEQATMTRSIPAIYERMSELSLGTNDYIRLRRMNIALGTQSELDTLRKMLDDQERKNIEDSDREELPTMGDRAENNRPYIYGQRTKQTKRRTPDGEARRQQRIVFTDEDRRQSDSEAGHDSGDDMEKEMGFKPFGQEW